MTSFNVIYGLPLQSKILATFMDLYNMASPKFLMLFFTYVKTFFCF